MLHLYSDVDDKHHYHHRYVFNNDHRNINNKHSDKHDCIKYHCIKYDDITYVNHCIQHYHDNINHVANNNDGHDDERHDDHDHHNVHVINSYHDDAARCGTVFA